MSAADGNEFIVNNIPDSVFAPPSIAYLSDDTFVIIWNTQSGDIKAQRFGLTEPGGTEHAIGPEFIVNHTTAGHQGEAQIAALADGGYVITWTNGEFPDEDIFAQRFGSAVGSSGEPVLVGPEFTVNTTLTREQVSPSIGGTGDGGYTIKWISTAIPGQFQILSQHFSANVGSGGAPIPVGGETLYELIALGLPDNTKFIELADGDYVAIWAGGGQTFGQRFDGDPRGSGGGSVSEVGAQFTVTTATNGGGFPAVAPLADGGYVVGWTTDNGKTGYDVYYQRYAAEVAANGNAIRDGSTHMVNQSTDAYQWNLDVAASPNGGFVFSWVSNDQNVDHINVYARAFAGDDAPVATDDAASVLKGGTLTLKIADLVANDTDPNDDPLTISAVGAAQHGTATLQGSNIIFQPEAGFAGAASFEYTLDDGHGNNGVGSVAVNIKPLQSVIGVVNWVQTPTSLSWNQANSLALASGGFLYRDVHPGTETITNLSELIAGGGSVFYEQPTWFGATAANGGWRWSTGEPIDELKFTAANPDPNADADPSNDIAHPVLAGATWRAPRSGETVDQVLMEFDNKASIKGTQWDDHFFGALAAGQSLRTGSGNDQYWGPGGGKIYLGDGNDIAEFRESDTQTPWTPGNPIPGTTVYDGKGADHIFGEGVVIVGAAIDGDNDEYADLNRLTYTDDRAGFQAIVDPLTGIGTAVGAGIGEDSLSNIFEIVGGSGNDLISGIARIQGGAGDDFLAPLLRAEGGAGNDILIADSIYRVDLRGGAGDDVFEIYTGASVSGGAGVNRYVMRAPVHVTINDMGPSDRIDLTALLSVSIDQAFAQGYLHVTRASQGNYSVLEYDANGGGDNYQPIVSVKDGFLGPQSLLIGPAAYQLVFAEHGSFTYQQAQAELAAKGLFIAPVETAFEDNFLASAIGNYVDNVGPWIADPSDGYSRYAPGFPDADTGDHTRYFPEGWRDDSNTAVAALAEIAGPQVIGSSGDDYIFGNAPNLFYSGGEGNDTLIGTDWTDIIDGGAGNDTITGLGGADILIDGEGEDYVTASLSSTIEPTLDGDNDVFVGGSVVYISPTVGISLNGVIASSSEIGNDTLDFVDRLFTGDGDDTGSWNGLELYTQGGNDTVRAGDNEPGTGPDGVYLIDGGAGNDDITLGIRGGKLFGDDGDDILRVESHEGVTYAAEMTGGAGADQFVFDGLTYGSVRINDFTITGDAKDIINLSGVHWVGDTDYPSSVQEAFDIGYLELFNLSSGNTRLTVDNDEGPEGLDVEFDIVLAGSFTQSDFYNQIIL